MFTDFYKAMLEGQDTSGMNTNWTSEQLQQLANSPTLISFYAQQNNNYTKPLGNTTPEPPKIAQETLEPRGTVEGEETTETKPQTYLTEDKLKMYGLDKLDMGKDYQSLYNRAYENGESDELLALIQEKRNDKIDAGMKQGIVFTGWNGVLVTKNDPYAKFKGDLYNGEQEKEALQNLAAYRDKYWTKETDTGRMWAPRTGITVDDYQTTVENNLLQSYAYNLDSMYDSMFPDVIIGQRKKP